MREAQEAGEVLNRYALAIHHFQRHFVLIPRPIVFILNAIIRFYGRITHHAQAAIA
jgi:hypothetical protein